MSKAREAKRLNPKTQMKICGKCGQEKHFTEFEYRATSPDGLRAHCRDCMKARYQRWLENGDNRNRKKAIDLSYYRREKPRIRIVSRQKYYANRDAIRAERKRWAKENPEKITAWNKLRRQRHGDKIRAKRRQHYRENQAIYVANARKREKRVARATPSWADLKAIERFYVEAARLTKETGIKHHVDHIYPIRSKIMCGLHVEGNLQVLPAAINLLKSNRIAQMAGEPLCCAWPSFM
jgi:hypothetical protein